MNYELEQITRSQLGRNEKLLWSGQPRGGIKLRAADALMIPFSVMWGGFAIFWEMSVLKQGAPGFFALWGIPFVLVGLYLIVGRFFVDAWQRSRTYYALTNERAIIVSGLLGQKVKSLPLRTMSDITLTERPDGSGSIALGPASGPYGWMTESGWPGMGRYQPPTFEMIENVRQVHTLLRDAQTSATEVRA
jgi:PH (Pleckstrin Homology) domain-containing protein